MSGRVGEPDPPPIDREADRAWSRVRELDERVTRLERIDPDDLSDEARRRLDSARARRARAANRALLADELADQLAALKSQKKRPTPGATDSTAD